MKIGIIDHQLTNYHIKRFHAILTGEIGQAAGVEIVGAAEGTPSDEGKKWAADNNVKYIDSIDQLIAGSDALLVLAPNNPEQHLALATPALKSGKPVFIDKMLAQTPEDARAIVKLSQEHNSPLFCSSSLRFAKEVTDLAATVPAPYKTFFVRGMGKFPIYAVHSLAIAMPFIGHTVKRVIDTGKGVSRTLTLDNGAVRATVEVRESKNQSTATPWEVGVLADEEYHIATVKDTAGFYENLARAFLDFFKTGKSPLSVEEMLSIVIIQDAAEKSMEQGGVWVEINPAG